MFNNIKSIRTFIGTSDFDLSRSFYNDLGFTERELSPEMSYFSRENFGFYLQDYYVKDWVDNSMIFLEVDNLEETHKLIKSLGLTEKYTSARILEIHDNDWGNEFFIHDPMGVLWHIGEFKK